MIKKIKQWHKDFWHKEYRVAVWIVGGTCIEHTANKRRQVYDWIDKNTFVNDTWTLYKSGRFFLPEREIERSTDKYNNK